MTETMVEKVATAIDRAYSDWFAQSDFPKCPWLIVAARGAIEAMREPTETMIDAYLGHDYPYDPPRVKDGWQIMIDAALVEGK